MAAAMRRFGSLDERTQRLALAIAAFVLAAGLGVLRLRFGPPDFCVFWEAARHWRAQYDPALTAPIQAAYHVHVTWPYAYPPTFLLFTYPFGLIPLGLSFPLWAGLTAALFVYAASFMIRPPIAAGLLFIAPPVVVCTAFGQTALPVGAAMIGGWLLLERRPALAGILFAVAACIKPQAMLLAPIVLWGRWRTLGWAVAAGLAMMAASLAFGVERWIEWPHALTSFQGVIPRTERANPSALIQGGVLGPVWALTLAAFGVYKAWTRRSFLWCVGGALCATPYAHAYDLVPLAPLCVAWLVKPRTFGWGYCVAGAVFLAGLVETPAAVLALLLALAALEWPWRDIRERALGLFRARTPARLEA
ncbi:MAG: glycosyltransferase family 87 protein [Caulobacterales bacterium]